MNAPMTGQPKPKFDREVWWNPARKTTLSYMYGSAAGAPVGAACVFPAPDRDSSVVREVAVKWAPPFDRDEEYPWIILGSEGPQRLSNDSVDDCEWLPCIRPGYEYGLTDAPSGSALEVIAGELRRLNDGRDQFHREVLEVLTQAKDGERSLRSEQPLAAPGCRVCGNTDTVDGEECLLIPLTHQQWDAHRQHYFEQALSFEEEWPARRYADERMLLDFGGPPIGPVAQSDKEGK